MEGVDQNSSKKLQKTYYLFKYPSYGLFYIFTFVDQCLLFGGFLLYYVSYSVKTFFTLMNTVIKPVDSVLTSPSYRIVTYYGVSPFFCGRVLACTVCVELIFIKRNLYVTKRRE